MSAVGLLDSGKLFVCAFGFFSKLPNLMNLIYCKRWWLDGIDVISSSWTKKKSFKCFQTQHNQPVPRTNFNFRLVISQSLEQQGKLIIGHVANWIIWYCWEIMLKIEIVRHKMWSKLNKLVIEFQFHYNESINEAHAYINNKL